MDHAHAHPPSRHVSPAPATLPSRLRPSRDQDVDRLSASPSARQQRLLRTRNVRFPAKKLSISSLSSRFSQLIKSNEQPAQAQSPTPTNQENNATVYRPHRDYGHSHSTSSLGILEEITNSIGVHSKSQNKRAPIPIFQDSPHRGLLEESPYGSPSPYLDASSQINSPSTFDHIHDSLGSMGLREISGNARKVSSLAESPPIVATIHSGRRRKSTAKSRFNSEEYIEHIERELELVKDAVYSPTSNRPWKEKLKSSRIENERLRKEIIDVKSAFEAEVQKTVEHMAAAEFDLRRKIRSLEDELESKESTIQQLECRHDEKRLDQSTVDTLKATIDKLETDKLSLEQENESMTRRNEVLSQLLALSPTKSQQFDLSSPVRAKNNPRPMSMMIRRMPSSPGGACISRPQSVVASPSASTSGYFSPKSGSVSTPPHGRMQDLAAEGVSAPSFRRSLTGSTSRRSTLTSEASMSPSALDLQQTEPDMSDQPAKQPNPKRRTRRFLQGSTQLKPLLLPTLTGENGVLNSAYSASPVQGQRREFSEESTDPTTTFLSKSPAQYEPELDSYPFGHDSDTFTASSRHLAYQSLEGVLDDEALADGNDVDVSTSWGSFAHALPTGNIDMSVEEAWENPSQGTPDQWLHSGEQDIADDFDMTILPSYAYKQSEATHEESVALGPDASPSPAVRHGSVEMPEPLFSPFSRQKASHYFVSPNIQRRIAIPPDSLPVVASNDSRNSRKRRKLSISDGLDAEQVLPRVQQQPPVASIEAVAAVSASIAANTPFHNRKSSSSRLFLMSPPRTKSPLEILQQRNIGARPLAAVTIKTIYGTLSRYTSYMREIKGDPLAVARRVIANAWHANWTLLGKLSWWILGVFLGPSRRDYQCHAWDWDDYDAESIADQHCQRRSMDLDGQHLRLLPPSQSQSPERRVRFDEQHSSYRTRGSRSPARPAFKKRLGWGESLLLWGKFSVAIMMAVGGAVVKGPAEMMRDIDERSILGTPARRSRDTRNESPSRRSHKERAIHSPMKPMNLPATANNHRRLKTRSPSPPPSARMLLQSSPQGSSSPQTGPSSAAFQFGSDEIFQFSSPCRDHDWGEFDFERTGEDTLKPGRPERAVLDLDNIFSSPLTGPGEPILNLAGNRRREYDPESAGAGLVFFDPLNNVSFAENASGGDHGVDDN